MKRLILAIALALSITALGAGPAAATTLDSTTALTSPAGAQAAGEDALPADDATDNAEDPGAEEPGTDNPDNANDDGANDDGAGATDPGETTPPGEETDDSEEPTEDSEPTEDGEPTEDEADDDADEVEPIDATFSLEKTEMTAEEIGDPNAGIRFSIDSLKAGDVINASPGDELPMSAEKDGVFTAAITGNTELKAGDTLDITVTVDRAETESQIFHASVEVIAEGDDGDDSDDGDEAPAAQLSVSPKTVGLHDFFNTGVGITLSNCVMDEEVNFRVSTLYDPDTTVWEDTQFAAGEDAAGFTTFIPSSEGGTGWVGEFLVMASCGERSAETTFTVTDDSDAVDPKLNVDPQKISGEDFVNRDKGVTMTVLDCKPGTDVRIEVWGQVPSGLLYDKTVEANENGAASVQTYGLEDNPGAYVGGYDVVATCMDVTMKETFVVTGEKTSGSDSGNAGDSGKTGSMPRTGVEITGLAAGALLILGGAATIIFARRRARGES